MSPLIGTEGSEWRQSTKKNLHIQGQGDSLISQHLKSSTASPLHWIQYIVQKIRFVVIYIYHSCSHSFRFSSFFPLCNHWYSSSIKHEFVHDTGPKKFFIRKENQPAPVSTLWVCGWVTLRGTWSINCTCSLPLLPTASHNKYKDFHPSVQDFNLFAHYIFLTQGL